jgi:hypothetical protein
MHNDGRILNRRKKILFENGKNIEQEEGRMYCMRLEEYLAVGVLTFTVD